VLPYSDPVEVAAAAIVSQRRLGFHCEVLHTSWPSVSWGAALNKPAAVKPRAAREINDLRVMLFISVLAATKRWSAIDATGLRLLEKDLGHHSLVFVIQQMAMK